MITGSGVKPSPGYLYSLCFGCLGAFFLSLAISGALVARNGGDPESTVKIPGTIFFILAYVPLFAMRLIFWPPASPSLRVFVRRFITLVFVATVIATAVSIFMTVSVAGAKDFGMFIYFTVIASLCQIASVTWLVRYRQEGYS